MGCNLCMDDQQMVRVTSWAVSKSLRNSGRRPLGLKTPQVNGNWSFQATLNVFL